MSFHQSPIYVGVSTGITAYLFCKSFEISRPFEKSILVAVHIGLSVLAKRIIESQHQGRPQVSPLRNRAIFLCRCSHILIIPFTFYIARCLNFKTSAYLPQIGLAYLSNETVLGLLNLYDWLK